MNWKIEEIKLSLHFSHTVFFLIIHYMLSLTNTHYLVCGLYISDVKVLTAPTYSETVLLGKKLGCKVSIRSTSSHTTLIRTCCLLNSLDLSAEQWQLSMIRSGQFLLLRLDLHSRTITHNKVSALIVDWDNLKYKKKKGKKGKKPAIFKWCRPSFCDKQGPFHIHSRYNKVSSVPEPKSRSQTPLVTCCAVMSWILSLFYCF